MDKILNRTDAKECLFQFADTMQGICQFFLIDGTLLGAVREGDFIAHDSDIDVGIWEDDFDPAMLEALKNAGFTLEQIKGAPNDGLFVQLTYNGVQLDVFGVRRSEHYTTEMHSKFYRMRAYLRPFSLAPITFLDRNFLAPNPPEQYLEDGYGPEWRIPVSAWSFRYSPPNLRIIGGPFKQQIYRIKRWWRLRQLA